jgi:S1-C subfamily serine protease
MLIWRTWACKAGLSMPQPQLKLPVTQGVLVTRVDSNNPVAQAGLNANDIIVRINNTAVRDVSSLMNNVLNKNPGEQVMLQIYRGHQRSR